MKIAYHNRSRLSKELEGDAIYLSFDDLLAQSDVLSLNLSLNAKTRHIISAPEFAKMKDGVVCGFSRSNVHFQREELYRT